MTRAWCYPLENGDGTVVVRFVCDDLADISPTSEMVKQVQSYIDSKRPVTADVTVMGPTLKAVNIEISTLTPDTSDVRAAVEAELKDLFMKESEPSRSIYLSHIRAAISAAAGEVDHVLVSPTRQREQMSFSRWGRSHGTDDAERVFPDAKAASSSGPSVAEG